MILVCEINTAFGYEHVPEEKTTELIELAVTLEFFIISNYLFKNMWACYILSADEYCDN